MIILRRLRTGIGSIYSEHSSSTASANKRNIFGLQEWQRGQGHPVSLADQLLQAELPGAQLSDLYASTASEIADHSECGGFRAEDCDGNHLDAAAEGETGCGGK